MHYVGHRSAKNIRYDDEAKAKKSIWGSTMNKWRRAEKRKALCHVIQPQFLSRPTCWWEDAQRFSTQIFLQWNRKNPFSLVRPRWCVWELQLFFRMRSLNSNRVRSAQPTPEIFKLKVVMLWSLKHRKKMYKFSFNASIFLEIFFARQLAMCSWVFFLMLHFRAFPLLHHIFSPHTSIHGSVQGFDELLNSREDSYSRP